MFFHPQIGTSVEPNKAPKKKRAKQDPDVLKDKKRARRFLARKLRRIRNRKASQTTARRKQQQQDKASEEQHRKLQPTLFDKLMRMTISVLRGKRLYTPGLLEEIAKIGSCPSAGGSRAAIARILSHMGKVSCVQGVTFTLSQVRCAPGLALELLGLPFFA